MTKKQKKNYIQLGVILITSILITLVSSNLYRTYEQNKINKSYISKYVTSITCNELSNAITELSSNTFLYLSYTGNNNIYDFEKQFKKVLKEYNLEENIIFVDCTNELNEKNNVESLKNILTVGSRELTLPAIIYFKDNNPIDFIDSKEGLISIGDFSKVLDRNEIEKGK